MQRTIGSLGGGESTTFSFDLVAFPDAAANTYKIPVTLTYDDEQGNSDTQTETIGIAVGSAPELLVYLERNDLEMETLKGEVVIRFVNKGLSEIKLLELEVEETEQLSVASESNILYVGNIDADDYESADLTLTLTQESVDVPIKVTYRDALNTLYEETYTIHIDAKKGNGQQSSNIWIWAILLIIVVAGFFWWRSRSAKKRRH
jgi:hypothetical protein